MILDEAVLSKSRIKIGSALADFGKRHGRIDLYPDKDQIPTKPVSFE